MYKFLGVEKENKTLVTLIYLLFLTSGTVGNLFGAILPDLQKAYNLSYEFRGLLLSAHQTGNLIALFISGLVTALLGRKNSTILLASGTCIGLIIMTQTGIHSLLLLAFILTGIARGGIANTSSVTISENAKNTSSALNLLHACFAIGAFSSPLLVVFTSSKNWKITPIALSILVVLVLIAVSFSNLSNKREKLVKEEKVPFISDPNFILVTSILFFYLSAEASIMGWMVTFFYEEQILTETLAKSSQTYFWIMIMVGRMLCAIISPKMKNKNILCAIMAFGTFFSFIGLMLSTNPIVSIIMVFCLGLFCSGMFPTVMSTMKGKYLKSTSISGVCLTLATLGALSWPIIMGFAAGKSNITVAMATILIPLVLMSILVLVKAAYEKKTA